MVWLGAGACALGGETGGDGLVQPGFRHTQQQPPMLNKPSGTQSQALHSVAQQEDNRQQAWANACFMDIQDELVARRTCNFVCMALPGTV